MDQTFPIRAMASHWKHAPIKKPAKAPWDAEISGTDLASLLLGSVPSQMEDKWFCFADDADSHGNILVHLVRSWSGAEIIVLRVRAALDGTGLVNERAPAKVTEITWEDDSREEDRGEAWAKQRAEMVCRGILQCELAAPKSRACQLKGS
ncbi:hypothetical protein HRG_003277 [Hirsutella rhossiliensis]|uniref:Uncharacterized protein n=1 Tax=Hirsutella rhossiliensis TaxID=111463 RepID=A0A9P8N3F7_9HYPO|nr:uncharacterized protein HRG_03277 [Hirsutella rhossiliensis]KAH0965261.1 hypothetical protein HRG_03277 [Hirsutella rhossiliensis]